MRRYLRPIVLLAGLAVLSALGADDMFVRADDKPTNPDLALLSTASMALYVLAALWLDWRLVSGPPPGRHLDKVPRVLLAVAPCLPPLGLYGVFVNTMDVAQLFFAFFVGVPLLVLWGAAVLTVLLVAARRPIKQSAAIQSPSTRP